MSKRRFLVSLEIVVNDDDMVSIDELDWDALLNIGDGEYATVLQCDEFYHMELEDDDEEED